MRCRVPLEQAGDLLQHSDFQVLAPAGEGQPVVVPRSPRARRVLRRRTLRRWARVGARYLAGAALGQLPGWAATALGVLAH